MVKKRCRLQKGLKGMLFKPFAIPRSKMQGIPEDLQGIPEDLQAIPEDLQAIPEDLQRKP